MDMMKASKKCSVEVPLDDPQMDFQEIINEIRSAALRYRGQDSDTEQYYKLVPASRFRRDAHDPAQMLAHLKEKMTYKIANVTCMLKELKYKNDDNTPNYKHVESHINKINDAYLRNQLQYGYDMCKDFAHVKTILKLISQVCIVDFVDMAFNVFIVRGIVVIFIFELFKHTCDICNLVCHLLLQVCKHLSWVVGITSETVCRDELVVLFSIRILASIS